MMWPPGARCIRGMKWFRSNIKHGSRLALFALAVQFVLSFGHFHGITAQAAPAIQSGPVLSDPAYATSLPAPDTVSHSTQPSPSDPDSDRQPADACAICAVMSAFASFSIFFVSTLLCGVPPRVLLVLIMSGFNS